MDPGCPRGVPHCVVGTNGEQIAPNKSITAINRSSRFWFTEAAAAQQRLKTQFCNINLLNEDVDF